jgi:hypothetical protein
MPNGRHRRWLLGLVCLVSGCAHTTPPPYFFAPPDLPIVVPSFIPVDVSSLPMDAGSNSADATYHGLTEDDCPWYAAHASTLGNLLDQKAQFACSSWCKCLLKAKKSSEQSCTVLQLAADEARNRAASDALETFYRLIEAEGRQALVFLALKEVKESLMRAEELQAKGLPPPVETAVIRKKLTDLHSDDVNLRITILQLNARLKVLLGLPSGDYSVWPLADLKVVQEAIDIDQAVDYGLNHRQDLALLGTLAYCLDADSLAIAKQALETVSPLLGEPCSPHGCASLLACLDRGQTEAVGQQLQIVLEDRHRQATEEIRQAVGVVVYRVQLVILARQKVEIADRRIKELEERKQKGLNAEEDLSTARLNLYEAQGEQLREVINWKIARAQLRQAQGRLLEKFEWIDTPPPHVILPESAP